jgi:hypothetical protein
MDLGTVLGICLGLGLAAACGFRVFVPLLALSLAAHTGYLDLGGSFVWLGETPALVTLAVATVVEIVAYYVPWLDNLLDALAGPAAVVAGVMTTASVVTGLDPMLKWSLAVIAGGGLAGSVQAMTTGVRGASTITTGGLGNFVVSTLELIAALVLAVLALLVPVAAAAAILVVLFLIARRLLRGRPAQATT